MCVKMFELRSVSVLKLHFSKVEANSSLLPVRHMSCNHFGTKSFPPFFSSHWRLSLAFNAFLRLKASLGADLASPPAPGLASGSSALVGHMCNWMNYFELKREEHQSVPALGYMWP